MSCITDHVYCFIQLCEVHTYALLCPRDAAPQHRAWRLEAGDSAVVLPLADERAQRVVGHERRAHELVGHGRAHPARDGRGVADPVLDARAVVGVPVLRGHGLLHELARDAADKVGRRLQ